MWNIAKFSLKPGTKNVHCIMMAQQWMLERNLPFRSAVDVIAERKKDDRVSVSPSGQKQRRSSSKG